MSSSSSPVSSSIGKLSVFNRWPSHGTDLLVHKPELNHTQLLSLCALFFRPFPPAKDPFRLFFLLLNFAACSFVQSSSFSISQSFFSIPLSSTFNLPGSGHLFSHRVFSFDNFGYRRCCDLCHLKKLRCSYKFLLLRLLFRNVFFAKEEKQAKKFVFFWWGFFVSCCIQPVVYSRHFSPPLTATAATSAHAFFLS